jgi:acylglycerol lipase
LAVHGLGEHINRYGHVFSKFAASGICVKGLDMRGHGRTLKKNPSYPAGYTPLKEVWEDILLMDAVEVEGVPKGLPTFVMGHSLGGLTALSFVYFNANRLANFKGVIAQCELDLGLSVLSNLRPW